tara:strand:+ start:147 stop:644 length:498 start_codon:yes stop_codon:yes gene_type:complete
MGRYAAKKRQESKKKPERKAVEYTTAKGRGKNRVATKTKLKDIPADKRPADMQKGKIYGDKTAATGRNWSNGYGAKSSKPSTGNHKSAVAPPAPKLPPKPSTKVSSPKKAAATSSKKLTPMQQWAKAHPELAKKVKKGQSGAKELKIGRSTKKRTWLDKNYKPGK